MRGRFQSLVPRCARPWSTSGWTPRPRAYPRREGHRFGTTVMRRRGRVWMWSRIGTYQSKSHQTTQSTSASTGERETGDRIGFALG